MNRQLYWRTIDSCRVDVHRYPISLLGTRFQSNKKILGRYKNVKNVSLSQQEGYRSRWLYSNLSRFWTFYENFGNMIGRLGANLIQ